ncbi:EthD family reductase [Dermacoccaceae bacterium W4C1]
MYNVTVIYGKPDDPAAFDEYYTNTHAPLALKIPGLTGFSAGHSETLDGSEPASYFVATLTFADKDSAAAGLTAPDGQAAVADVPNFATGGATLHFAAGEITSG